MMDGQNDLGRDHPLIGHNRFLSVARIIETMDMQRFCFGDEDRVDWITENKIQPVMWDNRFRRQPAPDSRSAPRT